MPQSRCLLAVFGIVALQSYWCPTPCLAAVRPRGRTDSS